MNKLLSLSLSLSYPLMVNSLLVMVYQPYLLRVSSPLVMVYQSYPLIVSPFGHGIPVLSIESKLSFGHDIPVPVLSTDSKFSFCHGIPALSYPLEVSFSWAWYTCLIH